MYSSILHMLMRLQSRYIKINVANCPDLQVIIENQGDIEASYSVQPTSTLFGPKFSFSPSAGHLLPDCLQAIQVCCYSSSMVDM